MGRKSKKASIIKPFCYFCLREFDNEKILIQHQKAKHFKCTECNRKLETANGLMVHMQQVHKMSLKRVPNSLEGRDNTSSTIQGMNGVPVEVIEEHRLQHLQNLSNLNKQKQQRINWAQVNAPNSNALTNPSLNQTQTQTMAQSSLNGPSHLQVTNSLTSNFSQSSFSGPGSLSVPGSGSVGDDALNSNKLLILDPNGMPIYQPVQTPVQQPTQQPQLFQPPNKMLFKTSFSPPLVVPNQGFNGTVPVSQALTSSGGFSGPPGPAGFSQPEPLRSEALAHESFRSEVPEAVSSPTQESEDDSFVTIHYKATGSQPLYVPAPSLGNTKLSYSSDSVSIEELRAKVKFNWHETPA